jgi:hypothetical protein
LASIFLRGCADPGGLCLDGFGGCLRAGCSLLDQSDGRCRLRGLSQGLVLGGSGRADPLGGFGVSLADRGVAVGFCCGNPHGGDLPGGQAAEEIVRDLGGG